MSVERNDAPHLSADEVAQPTSEMLNTDYAEDGMTQDPGCSNSLSVDEIVSWLHYPLDDAFEKSYCSDLFGHWPPSGTQLYKDPSVPESIHPGPVSMGMGHADSSEFLVGNAANCSSTLNVGSSSLGRSVSAEKALALGAGRAAGLIAPAGVEAFNKVRTSLQPRVPKLGSPSFSLPKDAGSFQAACSSASLDVSGGSSAPTASAMLPPRIHCQGSNANRFSLQPNGGKPKTSVRPSALPPAHAAGKCIADEGTSSKQRGGGANSSTYSSLAESSTTVLRKELDTSINCSRAPDTGGGLLPQQAMLVPKREMDQATSGSSAVDTGSTQVNMDTFGKVIQRRTVVEGREKRLGVREAPEMVRTFSGGSQTSADRSTKEATSSGKRILEDSECYSEDAEGESAETKHPQSRSTSKRSRAAEIHNQSERRRRDRINEKMKALQKLIPNSNKTDKASMLDEAIEYLKMLQLQLQMMSMRTGLSPVMIPTGVPHMQIPQMAPMHHPMGMGMTVGPPGMGMGMGLSMGMGAIDMQHAVTGHPLLTLPSHPASFYPPGISSTATATVTDSQIQASSATESSPIYFPHPHFHLAHQSLQSVNMDMYNAYLQQQPQQHQSQYANYSISNSKDGSSS